MLQPKQTKFRKMHKGRNRGLAQNGNTIAFGRFGLVASDRGRITARQIEAARRAMTRYIKRGGNIWIRIFPGRFLSIYFLSLIHVSEPTRHPRSSVAVVCV